MKSVVITVELPSRVRLQYVEQGDASGFPLILLHGYADSWYSFKRVLPYFPKYIHTFALTQRGHGNASQPVNGYLPRDFATDIAEFMEVLDLETAFILGGSSGGIIARRFVIDHPNRTLGLILAGSPFTLHDKPSVLELWDSTISKLKDPIDPNFVHGFVTSTLSQQLPRAFLKTILRENLKVPARVWKATLSGLLHDGSAKELNNVQAPTLIMWGDEDKIIPRSDQETLLERIAGSRLAVYHGAGHMLYWEKPAQFAFDVVAFIESINLLRTTMNRDSIG